MGSLLFRSVKKKYAGENRYSVADFNLQVEDGEFLVLVGPSGCGKSTILRMIAGLEDISDGEIIIGNELVNYKPSSDRNIAMVFQNYALYPQMSVYENIAFSLRMRKMPKPSIHERVRNAAKILEITPLLEKLPNQLSGGQRQRVALGRAIVREPEVFLMDEPLSNLDAKLRVTMREEIMKLHHRLNTTFIYVTHDQIEAMTMGTRIVVMKDGIMQQVGTPREIYSKPANMFVAAFIGSPPINFIAGVVQQRDGKLYFETRQSSLLIPEHLRHELLRRRYIDKPIKMGVRAESLQCLTEEEIDADMNGGNYIKGKVDFLEFMGADVYVHADLTHYKLTVRTAAVDRSYQVGADIVIAVNMNKVLFFDSLTEELLQ
ncbi:sn-glycerol-3-phosphate ABC transporter ATP-binding protein UgpC [Paenibacillus sp.]|uniref:ABC transporter ATP-binding protein n=1 Tax=Paenibacillus sp. TaxID=58172 RepID=UPI002811BBD6|nr:sn-glycerol-3-phosphate ABC transporter ATP-binding protein UgpC [Paenibacillus sp.]